MKSKKSAIEDQRGTVEFASVNDTTLEGAQIIGDRVIGTVAGDLNIISEQDTETNSRQQSSSCGSLSVSTGSVSGSYNSQTQTGTSDYASVDEQTGIYAGEGGFDITVGGNTHLEGAVIASKADPADNSLVTGTLTVEDIENKSSYEAGTSGWGGEFTYANNPEQGDKNANTGRISPSLPMNESGDASSTTKSTIAERSITITDEQGQLAKTGQTAAEAIESLNRDTDNAHGGALERPVNLDDILEKQAELAEASAAAGKAVAKTVGDISQVMYLKNNGDPRWNEGGIYKVILQGAGAALVAELGNGQGLDGALGAMASQLAAGKLEDFAKEIADYLASDSDAQKLIANLISNIVSSGIGIAVGGESSGSLASLMERHNRQFHEKDYTRIDEVFGEFLEKMATGLGVDIEVLNIENMRTLLLSMALSNTDVQWNKLFTDVAELSEFEVEFVKDFFRTNFGTNPPNLISYSEEMLKIAKEFVAK